MAKTAIIDTASVPEVFRIFDRNVGAPGPGEIRIAQKAVGLNFIDVYRGFILWICHMLWAWKRLG